MIFLVWYSQIFLRQGELWMEMFISCILIIAIQMRFPVNKAYKLLYVDNLMKKVCLVLFTYTSHGLRIADDAEFTVLCSRIEKYV